MSGVHADDVKSWTVDELYRWLLEKKLPKSAEKLKSGFIDGKKLLGTSEGELTSKLIGVPSKERKNLWQLICNIDVKPRNKVPQRKEPECIIRSDEDDFDDGDWSEDEFDKEENEPQINQPQRLNQEFESRNDPSSIPEYTAYDQEISPETTYYPTQLNSSYPVPEYRVSTDESLYDLAMPSNGFESLEEYVNPLQVHIASTKGPELDETYEPPNYEPTDQTDYTVYRDPSQAKPEKPVAPQRSINKPPSPAQPSPVNVKPPLLPNRRGSDAEAPPLPRRSPPPARSSVSSAMGVPAPNSIQDDDDNEYDTMLVANVPNSVLFNSKDFNATKLEKKQELDDEPKSPFKEKRLIHQTSLPAISPDEPKPPPIPGRKLSNPVPSVTASCISKSDSVASNGEVSGNSISDIKKKLMGGMNIGPKFKGQLGVNPFNPLGKVNPSTMNEEPQGPEDEYEDPNALVLQQQQVKKEDPPIKKEAPPIKNDVLPPKPTTPKRYFGQFDKKKPLPVPESTTEEPTPPPIPNRPGRLDLPPEPAPQIPPITERPVPPKPNLPLPRLPTEEKPNIPLPSLPTNDKPKVTERSFNKKAPKLPDPPEPEEKSIEAGLNKCSWFKNLSHLEIVKILKERKVDGAFILRSSSNKPDQPYTLTVYFKNDIVKLPIMIRDDNKVAIGTVKPNESRFSTVRGLVEYHLEFPMKLQGFEQADVVLQDLNL